MSSNLLLLAALDDCVFGHTEAKKALIVMLNRSRLRVQQKYKKDMDEDFLVSPLKILLIAPSGTGKSHLVTSLQRVARFPIVKVDATHLNPTGASGGIKPEKIMEMIDAEARRMCIEHPQQYPYLESTIDQVVVFIDEIDKLASSFDGSSTGNWNIHTQTNFLTLFDSKEKYKGVSFVFAGAFTAITGKKEIKKSLGFTIAESKEEKKFLDEEIIKMGIIPELIGRINAIIELDTFTEKDYNDILEQRLLPKKRLDLAAMGIFDSELTNEQRDILIKMSMKSGQGVRFLQRELDKIFLEKEFDSDIYIPHMG